MAEFDSAIPPGGQGKVTASIDSARFKGKIAKSVTLFSNDPEHERTILRLSAEISVPIDVRPSDRLVLRGQVAELKDQVLWLVSSSGEPFDITKMEKKREDLIVSFEPAPELQVTLPAEAGKKAKVKKARVDKAALASGHSSYKMTVKIAPTAQRGVLADRIRLTTTEPKMETIDINVSGRLEGNVTVRPERLFFLSANGNSTLQQEVRLTRSEGSLEVKKVTSSDPSFTASFHPSANGKEVVVEVVRSEASVGMPAVASLTIETNDPEQRIIEIPITAR